MARVMVVDDDEMVRDSVTALLSAMGYEVVQAMNGVDAVLTYQAMRASISLVIMDIVMPVMDGIAVANIFKAADPTSKIILISGYSDQLPAEANADAFLAKPFRASELCKVVNQVMGEGPRLPIPIMVNGHDHDD